MFRSGGRALDDRHRAKARTINQTPNTAMLVRESGCGG